MTLASAPFSKQTYSPGAQSEQELAYELLSEQVWSDQAYLAFSEAFNRPIELSDGRLVILPMPSLLHQRTLRQFAQFAQRWLAENRRGELLFAPHPVRLWPGKYREPDAMIWLNEHKERMGERESGPPDVALEILSPGNEPLDLEIKFREYAQAAIPEYWIVQPSNGRVSVYMLEGRAYRLAAHFGPGERARSVLLRGFEVPVSELLASEQQLG